MNLLRKTIAAVVLSVITSVAVLTTGAIPAQAAEVPVSVWSPQQYPTVSFTVQASDAVNYGTVGLFHVSIVKLGRGASGRHDVTQIGTWVSSFYVRTTVQVPSEVMSAGYWLITAEYTNGDSYGTGYRSFYYEG